MYEVKHKIKLQISLIGLSLITLLGINTGSIRAKHVHIRRSKIKRVIKHKKHKDHHFMYSNRMLRCLHVLIYHYYGLNMNHYSTVMMARYIFHQHNPSNQKMIRKFRAFESCHGLRFYRYWKRLHNHWIEKATFPKQITRPDLFRWQYNQQLKQASNQGSPLNNHLRINLINDINQTREQFHKRPLKLNLTMQQLADYRNPYTQYAYTHFQSPSEFQHICNIEHITPQQLKSDGGMTDNWAHGYDNNTAGVEYLRRNMFKYKSWGANNGDWNYGNHTVQPDGAKDKYSDYTPQGIAANLNDEEINHDNVWNMHNGHRKNELSPVYKYIGVGISYDPKLNVGTFNEQFGV